MTALKKTVIKGEAKQASPRIGTWPTPERPDPVAIGTVPLPDKPSLMVLRVGVTRTQARGMSSVRKRGGSVAIDTVPLPDKPSVLIVRLYQTLGTVAIDMVPLPDQRSGPRSKITTAKGRKAVFKSTKG